MDKDAIMAAVRRAHAAGDTAGAQRLAAMMNAAPEAEPVPEPEHQAG